MQALTKESPLENLRAFMTKFGVGKGLIRTDQDGELARSADLRTLIESKFYFIVKPTGANSPSQNGVAEIYNDKLAVKVQTLLYRSRLPAKLWSAALLHSVYLHNRRGCAQKIGHFFGLNDFFVHEWC